MNCSRIFSLWFSLRFDMHSWTKTHWKGNTYHETLQLMLYQQGFFRWAKCTWWTIKIYLLVYKLLGLMVEWIPAIRNKVEIIFSSKNHSHHCNSCEKKSIAVCIFAVLCTTSACGSKWIVSSAWFYFLLDSTRKRDKDHQENNLGGSSRM